MRLRPAGWRAVVASRTPRRDAPRPDPPTVDTAYGLWIAFTSWRLYERLPAVAEAQHIGKRGHHVHRHLIDRPAADRRANAHVLLEASGTEFGLQRVVLGPHGHLRQQIDVLGGPDREGCAGSVMRSPATAPPTNTRRLQRSSPRRWATTSSLWTLGSLGFTPSPGQRPHRTSAHPAT